LAITGEQKMPLVFLFYGSEDLSLVNNLAEKLEGHGVEVLSDEKFKPARPLIKKIEDAIRKADFVGVMLSQNSEKSPADCQTTV
jgi:predicted nucleotide-binding protein